MIYKKAHIDIEFFFNLKSREAASISDLSDKAQGQMKHFTAIQFYATTTNSRVHGICLLEF